MTTAQYASLEKGLHNPVERPIARYDLPIPAAAALKMLHDPIEFAQNIGRVIAEGDLEPLGIVDVPNQIEDAREELCRMLDIAIEHKDAEAIQAVRGRYEDFVTYAILQALEHGIALGAVLEQFRVGLVSVHELKMRGLSFGDVTQMKRTSEVRRAHGFGLRGQHPVAADDKPDAGQEVA